MVGVLTVTDAEDTSNELVVLLSETLETEETEGEFFIVERIEKLFVV